MPFPLATAPLFNFDITADNSLVLDLSAQNIALESVHSSATLADYIEQLLEEKGKSYAIGGYAEKRVVYQRFSHFNASAESERNIHLGLDIWAPALTAIYAPANAVLHSFAYNDNAGDYGATIILTHQEAGQNYHTLHGHLSLKSIENLSIGQTFSAGEHFAELGAEAENGGWPPHLHFQLIKDLGAYKGDYPGVVKESEKDFYLRNCPDPNVYLGIAEI
ncbi:MAG: peptidase M23 [Bacteroidetes bacterium]|nr:MAG: peptidase M23 [Bacteroidota bacterium]